MDSNNRGCFVDATPSSVVSGTAKTKSANTEFLSWLEQAAQLPGKGPLVTALMILAQSRELDRRQHILLTPRTLQEYGMNRVTAYRSLSLLEQAGLIRVQRRRGISPLVSILTPNAEEELHAGSEHVA